MTAELPLKAFIMIEEENDRLLNRAAAEIPAAERAALVERFYEHLGLFPGLRELLAEGGRGPRLKVTLSRYLDSLLEAPIDAAYLADRRRTGDAHLRIGLSPAWYLGAYAVFISWGLERLGSARDGRAPLEAFLKRILLDMVLVIETYVAGRVESLNREKSDLHVKVKDGSRRLVESERRYEDLVENAPEMIHQVDPSMHFVSVNRTELSRLGYTLEEMKSMTLEEIVPAGYREGIREHFKRVRVEGASSLETVFVTRSGEEFPVEIYATALTGLDGTFIQSRAFVRDLSERTRLERELVRWERLAAVGSMAAKVAHEIRNPLSSISLDAELLADEMHALPEGRRAYAQQLLATILAGVDRLNSLVEEYLAFARLPMPDLQEISLGDVFHRLQQLLAPELKRRGISLMVMLEENLPPIPGDSRQLEQLFLNLIRNSQDAMPRGGDIRIRAAMAPKSIEVTVADTGIGIPEESLPLIFDPFFTTKDTGTGLGLAYVQQVLQEHHARIRCSSQLGKGTEFRILFPRSIRAGHPAGPRRTLR